MFLGHGFFLRLNFPALRRVATLDFVVTLVCCYSVLDGTARGSRRRVWVVISLLWSGKGESNPPSGNRVGTTCLPVGQLRKSAPARRVGAGPWTKDAGLMNPLLPLQSMGVQVAFVQNRGGGRLFRTSVRGRGGVTG